MKEWLDDNLTKVLGWLQTTNATILTLVAMGQFDGLMSKDAVRWLGIIAIILGGSTVARGQSNTAKVRVAEAMKTAIEATPGTPISQSAVETGIKPTEPKP
jgi:phage tail sheath gpL-like